MDKPFCEEGSQCQYRRSGITTWIAHQISLFDFVPEKLWKAINGGLYSLTIRMLCLVPLFIKRLITKTVIGAEIYDLDPFACKKRDILHRNSRRQGNKGKVDISRYFFLLNRFTG